MKFSLLILSIMAPSFALAVTAPRGSFQSCRSLQETGTGKIVSVQRKQVAGSGSYTISLPRLPASHSQRAPGMGSKVEVVRCLPPGRVVQIATGQINEIGEGFYQAGVYVPLSVATTSMAVTNRSLVTHRNLYWQPMKGDVVRILRPRVTALKRVWPRYDFEVSQIFESQPGDEAAYLTLAPQGREELVKAFERLEKFQGRFLIEMETLRFSNNPEPEQYSEVRAGLVANYLSRVFEMPPERFIVRVRRTPQSRDGFVEVPQNFNPRSAGKLTVRTVRQ